MATLKMLFLANLISVSFANFTPSDAARSSANQLADPNDPENTFYVVVTFDQEAESKSLLEIKALVDTYNNELFAGQKLKTSVLYMNGTDAKMHPLVVIRRFLDEAKANSYNEQFNNFFSKRSELVKSIYLNQVKYRQAIKENNFGLLGY